MDKDLYTMSLHDEINISRGCRALRVPGGWIYFFLGELGEVITSTFVAFSDQFDFNGGD